MSLPTTPVVIVTKTEAAWNVFLPAGQESAIVEAEVVGVWDKAARWHMQQRYNINPEFPTAALLDNHGSALTIVHLRTAEAELLKPHGQWYTLAAAPLPVDTKLFLEEKLNR